MAWTNIQICNMALDMAATRSTIGSLSENTREAQACSRWYDIVVLDTLQQAQWNFGYVCRQLALLKALPGTPENPGPSADTWQSSYPMPPWNYEYAMPSDASRAVFVIPQGAWANLLVQPQTGSLWPLFRQLNTPFQVAGGDTGSVLLTMAEQALLVYIKNAAEQFWTPAFVKAVAYGLAMNISVPLSGNFEVASGNKALYEEQIANAQAADANNNLTIQDIEPEWLQVRYDGAPWPGVYWPGGPGQ